MQGITNAPQGGSGGGEWTIHTSKNWSDILQYVSSPSSKWTVLKDCKVYAKTTGALLFDFAKGTEIESSGFKGLFRQFSGSGSTITFEQANLASSSITGDYIRNLQTIFGFTTNGSTVTVTTTNNDYTTNKSQLVVMVKE